MLEGGENMSLLTIEQRIEISRSVDAPPGMTDQALLDAQWMKAAGMGVYSSDLSPTKIECQPKKHKGVAIGQIYSAHRRVEMTMLGIGDNYGGTK